MNECMDTRMTPLARVLAHLHLTLPAVTSRGFMGCFQGEVLQPFQLCTSSCVHLFLAVLHQVVWERVDGLGCKLEMLVGLWPTWRPPFVCLCRQSLCLVVVPHPKWHPSYSCIRLLFLKGLINILMAIKSVVLERSPVTPCGCICTVITDSFKS